MIEKNQKQEEISEELNKKLEECQKQKSEFLAGWQRARADFLNYKKEEMERIGEILKYANQGLILKILPILDNFDLVEKKLPENLKNEENVKGILQIKTQILDFLKNQGIEEIEITPGEAIFDPNFHEAVGTIGGTISVYDVELGIIEEEIQKGYKLHGRVIRPAKVKISFSKEITYKRIRGLIEEFIGGKTDKITSNHIRGQINAAIEHNILKGEECKKIINEIRFGVEAGKLFPMGPRSKDEMLEKLQEVNNILKT